MLLRRLKSPLIVWGGVGVGFGVGITSTSTRTMATNAPLAALAVNADHSWVAQLSPDPETAANVPNQRSRQVRSGHYVIVKTSPLPHPQLVIYSKRMAAEVGLDEVAVKSDEFPRFFSGDLAALPVPGITNGSNPSWATPYALSIMGEPMSSQCPFGNGNGYGDGRAISIGEVVVDGSRWEFQLKGGGPTPFCRGADGRAVLRSSIREFLASEAMDALGVPTTRALSLVVSMSERSRRAWYSGTASGQQREIPTLEDPRIAHLSLELRQMLIAQLSQPSPDPDIMIQEQCAITCRVSPSFTRVGHLDLFARRARAPGATEAQKAEHAAMVTHALFREYPDLLPNAPLADRAMAMIPVTAGRLASLAAEWLRVGFCQGNFNADNCLVGGRTMDYGPFGFMDKYDPAFAKWTGSGNHFAFINQPAAAYANFATLARALDPLFDDAGKAELKGLVKELEGQFDRAVTDVWRRKLGLDLSDAVSRETASSLFDRLARLMAPTRTATDWTVFWRQLALVLELPAGADDAALLAPLAPAFYGDRGMSPSTVAEWGSWLRSWLAGVDADPDVHGRAAAAAQMRAENPKYVPREWMLVEAYKAAGQGDMTLVHELHELFEAPYDEHPDMEAKYYRTAPPEALTAPGTAVMT